MAELIIHQDKIPDNQELIKLCPFGAMEEKDGKVTISAACKMCRLCVRKGPKGAVEYVEDAVKPSVDKSAWKGIAVYVDHVDGKVHPVTLELLGKAQTYLLNINFQNYSFMMYRNWHVSRSSRTRLFLKTSSRQ